MSKFPKPMLSGSFSVGSLCDVYGETDLASSKEVMSDLLSGIASFTKTVADSFNTYEIRKLGDKVQGMVMNYTEAESKVREATNEDPWGPTGPQMAEIAHMTYQYDAFPEVMSMLWKRMLQDNKNAWRRVYKAGTFYDIRIFVETIATIERVVSNARDHLFEMRALESYKFIDDKGKDQGLNVRHRASVLFDLIQDDEQLKAERKKAKSEGKEKYKGYSKDDIRLGGQTAFSSNTKSFGDWKSSSDFSKRRNSCDEDGRDSYRHREVNSFQFPDEEMSHGGGDSPELGIREHTPELMSREMEDDEEFGDFALARNFQSQRQFIDKAPPSPSVITQSQCVQKPHPLSVTAVEVPVVVPPPPAGPSITSATVKHPAVTDNGLCRLQNKPISDLLGLNEFTSSGNLGSSATSFFNNTSTSPILQPSLLLKDMNQSVDSLSPILVSDEAFSNVNQQRASVVPPSFTDYSILPSATVAQVTFSSPLGGSATRSSVLGDVSTAHVPSADNSVKSPSQSIDLLAAASPLIPVPTHSPPVIPLQANVPSHIELPSKSAVKIPSTWADASNKLNIDLDDLGMKKKPQKHSVPMNQMTSLMSMRTTDRDLLANSMVLTSAPPHQLSADDMLDLLK
uniref:ENTH domain-containing protein n=1 Tax=Setaria digitata TaxID=48799 RepID=A0A915Q136_9BILA